MWMSEWTELIYPKGKKRNTELLERGRLSDGVMKFTHTTDLMYYRYPFLWIYNELNVKYEFIV